VRLAGKVAWVTGGSRGIGREVARRLAAEGARVVVMDVRPPEPGEAPRPGAGQEPAEGREPGSGEGRVEWRAGDVSRPRDVRATCRHILDRYGRLDILVNNAAVSLGEGALDTRWRTWRRTLAVNLTGPFLCARAAARAMVAWRISGRIINVSSINGLASERNALAYAVSKSALIGLTRALAVDLGPYGITVNAVAPGPILHPGTAALFARPDVRAGIERGTALGRPGTPADVAGAVAFLAADDASYVTGSVLVVDGGFLAYLRLD